MNLFNSYKYIIFAILGCFLGYIGLNSIATVFLSIALMTATIIFANNYSMLFIAFLLPIYAFTGFYDVPVNIPFVNVPANIYQYILLLFIVIYFISNWQNFKFGLDVIKPISFFIFLLLVNIIVSQNIKSSISYTIITYVLLIPYAIMFYYMLHINRNKIIFDYILYITLFVIFIVSVFQYLSNSLLFTEQFRSADNINELMKFGDRLRIPSLFKHSYALTEFNNFVFPFILAKVFTSNTSDAKKKYFLMCCSILVTTLWSLQRMGLLILLFQFALMYILTKEIKLNTKSIFNIVKLLLFVMIGTLCALLSEDGQMLFTRIVNTIMNPVNDPQDAISLIGRLFRITVAWNIFLDYPIWGAGVGTSPDLYPKYGWDITTSSGGPHNLYLFLLAETGALGFLAFIAGWLYYVKVFWSNIRNENGQVNANVVAGFIFCITVLIDGLFSGILTGASIVFLFIFLSYAYSFLPGKQLYISST